MALEENGTGNGMIMPVQPMGYGGYGGYGGYPPVAVYPPTSAYSYGGYGNGMFGGDLTWLIVLFLFGAMGGWGGFGGMGMGGFGGMLGGANLMMWPWLMTNQTDNLVTGGFNNSGIQNQLSGIQNAVTSGVGDIQLGIAGVNQNISTTGAGIQNSLCGGFAGVNQAICNSTAGVTAAVTNGFSQAEIANGGRYNALTQQLYNNEINNLNRSFAEQTANTAGFSGLQSQLAQCCCDNREAIAAANASNLAEHCQDRYDAQRNATDIITNATGNTQTLLNAINAGIQGIQDKLCQQEIDALKAANGNLQTQLAMKDLAASQAAQTAALVADNAAQTQYVVNRVAPYPTPSYIVSPPYGYNYGYNNGCGCNSGCGCNNGSF